MNQKNTVKEFEAEARAALGLPPLDDQSSEKPEGESPEDEEPEAGCDNQAPTVKSTLDLISKAKTGVLTSKRAAEFDIEARAALGLKAGNSTQNNER